MENKELRQLENSVEIVGTLKAKNLKMATSKKGRDYVSGNLIVQSEIGDKIHEHRVSVFMMKDSKLFKGIETVSKEYKAIEDVGKENADKIRVTGELGLNEWYNRNGQLIQRNEIKGVFFNRVEPDEADKALATIETVVTGFEPIIDESGLPTGEKKIEGFTVGWGNNVIDLVDAVVKADLVEAMENLYTPGSTGSITYNLNNYVLVDENPEKVETVNHGFGSQEKVDSQVATKYVNNIEVFGGSVPYFGTIEYTEEEIQTARQVRQMALEALQAPPPATPANTPGFGTVETNSSANTDNNPFEQYVSEQADAVLGGMPDF